MHYTSALIVAATLSGLASAAPKKRHFSVHQVDTGKKVLRSGPEAYRQALAKYGVETPSHVQMAVDAQQSGSVSATPQQYDAEYLAPVTIGGQQLTMDFDTGSADLWCFSTELPSSETNGQTLYNPSSGTQMNGYTWKISYGDGSGASGNVYADSVTIGGASATRQAVEAATSVSSEFSQNSADDGLVGFAFSSINTVQPQAQTTWFDTIKSTLPNELFTVTLRYHAAGTYDFGFIDSSKYTGQITYTPVNTANGFWEFTADGYAVSGSQKSESLDCIADTGTSLILLADDVVSAYWGQVSGASNSQSAGGYVFDCSTSLPDFSVIIGGASFLVPGEYLNYAPNGDGTCYGGLQSSAGIGFNILGDVFLKNQFVVFDSGNTQLGFAPQTGGQSNASAVLSTPKWAAKPRTVLSHVL